MKKFHFLNYKGIYYFYNKDIFMIKYIITIFNIIIGIFGTYIIYPLIKFYINVLKKEKEEKMNKKRMIMMIQLIILNFINNQI